MKLNTITLAFVAFSIMSVSAFSQTDLRIDMNKMNKLKVEGKLTGHEKYFNHSPTSQKVTQVTPHEAGEGCACWIERDTSWIIAPMDCQGASGGPGVPPEYRNDDWSACLSLPFGFCFYGQTVDSVYINNNGNISIGGSYSTFSPVPFPSNQYIMIAPFWSDVDTRSYTSGLVYYKLTPTHLIVQWDSVDYFWSDPIGNPTHISFYNTYQLIITNGNDPIIQVGQNVSFCYQEMQWTTGDASGGTNGFGGTPATVGVNQGNGIDYFQIGQYDAPGNTWDGPYGLNDQVNSLDNQNFIFNVCNTTSNTPPIALLSSIDLCDTLIVCEGDSAIINAGYLSPEGGQITTVIVDSTGFSGISIINDSAANIGGVVIQVTGQASNLGFHVLHISATDNGVPPLTTNTNLYINIINCQVGADDLSNSENLFSLSPNPALDQLTLNFSPGIAVSVQVEILDALGKAVSVYQANELKDHALMLDVSGLKDGVYFIRVNHGNRISTERFVKE